MAGLVTKLGYRLYRKEEKSWKKKLDNSMTQKLRPVTRKAEVELAVSKRPKHSVEAIEARYKRVTPAYSHLIPRYDDAKVRLIEEQCRGLLPLTLFSRARPGTQPGYYKQHHRRRQIVRRDHDGAYPGQ